MNLWLYTVFQPSSTECIAHHHSLSNFVVMVFLDIFINTGSTQAIKLEKTLPSTKLLCTSSAVILKCRCSLDIKLTESGANLRIDSSLVDAAIQRRRLHVIWWLDLANFLLIVLMDFFFIVLYVFPR